MSVNTQATALVYDCDGAATSFAVTYTFLNSAYLKVDHYDASEDDWDTLGAGEYTVSGSNVVTTATYPSPDKISISLLVPKTQTVDLLENGKISSDNLEEMLDKLTLITQQLGLTTDGTIALATPESPAPTLTLPSASDRANTNVTFDADGNVVCGAIAGAVASTWGATLIADEDAEEGRATLEVFSETESSANVQTLTDARGTKVTSFDVTADGWYTLLRTDKNASGFVKVSCWSENRKQNFTLSIYGDDETAEWDVGFIEQRQRGDSAVPGISRIRWGDAGNGAAGAFGDDYGLCLQIYVDIGTDTTATIKAQSFGGLDTDGGSTGIDFSSHTDNQTDASDNAVTVWTGDFYSFMFNSLVQINHRRYKDLEDIVVDGTTVTEVKPGVYRSISFTGNGTMKSGKYLVFGDFSISSGVIVSIENRQKVVAFTNYEMSGIVPSSGTPNWAFIERIKPWMVNAQYNRDNRRSGIYGGGLGGRNSNSSYSTGVGGSAPCGHGARGNATTASTAVNSIGAGGGWVFINVLGKVVNEGTIEADGSDSIDDGTNYGPGGGAGGYIAIRAFQPGNTWGTLSVAGGAGLSDSIGGSGGGGGLVEIYAPETPAPTTVLSGGSGGSGGGGSGSAGNDWLIDATSQPEYWDEGGSDTVTDDEYLYAGECIKLEGGWLP